MLKTIIGEYIPHISMDRLRPYMSYGVRSHACLTNH